jgi:hypothetical protein
MLITKGQPSLVVPLDIEAVIVIDTEVNAAGEEVVTIESKQKGTQCRVCEREITKFYGNDDWICLRHLSILGKRVYLRLRPKRYQCNCSHKPTTTQRLGWYEIKRPHTKAYAEHLMLQLVNSTVMDVSQPERGPRL